MQERDLLKTAKLTFCALFWGCTGLAWAQPFDHQGLSHVLKGHVVDGKVDYAALRRDSLPQLKAYVKSLAQARPDTFAHGEQVAFWLNAYNALVIEQICQGDAPSSEAARGNFFRQSTFLVAGQERSLDDIEHRALRPLAHDPRIHFVLVCGANSCPPLHASAFSGTADLEADLEQAARSYTNDPKNVTIDWEHHKILLNSIFDWYRDDFGDLLAFLARYREANEGQRLLQGKWTLDYRDYDWTTNQTP